MKLKKPYRFTLKKLGARTDTGFSGAYIPQHVTCVRESLENRTFDISYVISAPERRGVSFYSSLLLTVTVWVEETLGEIV